MRVGRPSGRNPGLDFKLVAQNSKLGDLAEGIYTHIKGLVTMLMDADKEITKDQCVKEIHDVLVYMCR